MWVQTEETWRVPSSRQYGLVCVSSCSKRPCNSNVEYKTSASECIWSSDIKHKMKPNDGSASRVCAHHLHVGSTVWMNEFLNQITEGFPCEKRHFQRRTFSPALCHGWLKLLCFLIALGLKLPLMVLCGCNMNIFTWRMSGSVGNPHVCGSITSLRLLSSIMTVYVSLFYYLYRILKVLLVFLFGTVSITHHHIQSHAFQLAAN